MGNRVFTNNPSSQLSASILAGTTSVTVTGGTGSLFPAPVAPQYAVVTIEDISGNIEICHLTSRAGDVLTLSRAQEGTAPQAFAAGSRIELRITRAILESFLQNDGDTITGVMTMSGAGRLQNGSWRDGTELVNTPIRGATGVTTNELVVRPSGTGATLGGSELLTQGNLNSFLPASRGLVHTNMIFMWFGSLISIPAGFALCDGTGGTPDLRGRFVIGAGGAYALSAVGGAESATSAVGGSHTHTITGTALTVAQMPSHSHSILASLSSGNTDPVTNLTGGIAGDVNNLSTVAANGAGTPLITAAGTGETHTHTADTAAGHTHTVTTMPPYYGLFYIMKT